MAATVRIACSPKSTEHPYLQSLYAALRGHGIVVSVDGIAFEDVTLKKLRHEFDVLHLHWPEHMWGAGSQSRWRRLRGVVGFLRFVTTARRLGICVVWSVHNLEPHEGGDWIDRLGYHALARCSSIVVCHDEHTRSQMINRFNMSARGPLLMRIGHAGLPMPHDRACVRHRWNVRPNERLLLSFGMLRPYKGLDLAIEALKQLSSDYRLLIAGMPLSETYLDELNKLCPGERVTIAPGTLTDQELADLLSACDCVLFPYRKITGSAALITALSSGKGVVASDLPYFREALSFAPEAGELCRVEDPTDLARAIEQFFAVPMFRRTDAASRIGKIHDWAAVVVPFAERLKVEAAERSSDQNDRN
jgi:beta-1,4-mannosyltransferase